MTEPDWGALAQDWLDRLAQCSEPGPGVSRLPFTPQHRAALDVLRDLMQGAGLDVTLDAAGTLIGRLDGPPGAPTLLMGSHQDSVREGGAYDGAMGVVLPALALQKLRADATRLPFAIEVLAFADEEGVRFPTALMGPRALAGTFDMAALDMQDASGITLRRAMVDFGLDPDALPDLKRDAAQVLGWLEIHLEQGPVLETQAKALGIVTAICGIERHSVTFSGMAAHAGTVPMHLRRDALAGAAQFILAVEALAQQTDGLLANVGTLSLRPAVVNAVPGKAQLSLELRAPQDATREQAARTLHDTARQIAADRGLDVTLSRSYSQRATPCDPALMARLQAASQRRGQDAPMLASGATHDTSAMADLCPVTLVFTRCKDGISHNPAENVSPKDMAAAVDMLAETLAGWA